MARYLLALAHILFEVYTGFLKPPLVIVVSILVPPISPFPGGKYQGLSCTMKTTANQTTLLSSAFQ